MHEPVQIGDDGSLFKRRLVGFLFARFDLNSCRRGRKRLDQLPPRAFRIIVDELHDALDGFGNRCGFKIEKLRTCDGDVRDGLVDLEKLQAMGRELMAQFRRELQRKILLLLPLGADKLLQ